MDESFKNAKSDNSDSSESSASGERRVSFSTIEIHEHAMIMGNSPSISYGCPLEIDWEEQCHYSVDVEEYEETRPPRRIRDQLAMPGELREEVLLESGYTKRQINRQISQIQSERHHASSKLHSTISCLSSLPKKLISKTKSKLTTSR
mmetsp:Transcript_27575/g.51741  ORF Transcript_27575/g.51741 Transcript_27575/m.51741 type:complete len:148 (-) Transcript_27575:437-880(-)|eukprot:CAMPEP_0178752438 /NCGR_PEP_ID=MMETSP0744-20121128/11065_1 /TAXON_ID=913974 /ORGANISM="Nitzschia punctata, Strain CCMP561" /LENGTH=147 /DNA_ID=CAMNT_0020406161 /DNA_START=315 /DNA_END=758 /DNA_ORIENTATION=+